jgi:hypothetical protein
MLTSQLAMIENTSVAAPSSGRAAGRLRLLFWAALWLVPAGASRATDRIILGATGANAGTTGVSLDASITHDQPIQAFSLALSFDQTILTLRQIVADGTDLAPLNPEFFYPTINNSAGTAVLGVIISYNDDPFTRVDLPPSPDTPQRVAVLRFDIAGGAPPGDYRISLTNRLGSPPISNVFSNAGKTIQPTLTPGTLTVNNENILLIESANVQPGSMFEVKALAKHPQTLQGFSIAFTYETSLLTFLDATYLGTMAAQAIKPQVIEFFEPQVEEGWSPTRNRLSVGAVLDFVPPFTGHEIPASVAQFQSLTRFSLQPKNDPALIGTSTELTLDNGGASSVNNIFIVDKQSFSPAFINGTIVFAPRPAFRRGYINADLRVDISDGIVMLTYLFLGGEPPSCISAADINDDNRYDVSDPVSLFNYLFAGGQRPREPFIACGADPTPDDLPCTRSAQCQ